jgi:rubrerythrin
MFEVLTTMVLTHRGQEGQALMYTGNMTAVQREKQYETEAKAYLYIPAATVVLTNGVLHRSMNACIEVLNKRVNACKPGTRQHSHGWSMLWSKLYSNPTTHTCQSCGQTWSNMTAAALLCPVCAYFSAALHGRVL